LKFKKNDLINPGPDSTKMKFSIFSYGHRNPQGLININNDIYLIEHGPKGGDEINLLKKGGNYGWPIYSLGSTYPGIPYPAAGAIKKFKRPLFAFIPSAAISDIRFCPENLNRRYSPYKCVLISSLRGESIFVTLIDPYEKRVISTEQIKVGMRVREFARGTGSEDSIYFSTDGYGVFELVISNVASPSTPRPQTWKLTIPQPQ
jgi:glucose/arabinose dehydrogenase